MDIARPLWQSLILKAWKKKPIVWLSGVRRSGKTTLAGQIDGAKIYNCDLPSTKDALKDPERFFKKEKSKVIVFDEIHQLDEASMLLKIAADEFKDKKILATGSSTLMASKKFKDTLTGRKTNIHFLPTLVDELEGFEIDLETRILQGGLPPAFLSANRDYEFYQEWLDSFYARDVQELFQIEKRNAFLKVIELLLLNNGRTLEVSSIGAPAGISRPTAIKYLEVLELTKAISLVRPFSGNSVQELVSQPKVYAFDTGFVCFAKQIKDLRGFEKGELLENLVLETFQSLQLSRPLNYWRTKHQQEIDFIFAGDPKAPTAIECKWQEKAFSPKHLQAFRAIYPKGINVLVTSDSHQTRSKKLHGLDVWCVNIHELRKFIGTELL